VKAVELGAFSVSLSVKDLALSISFYKKLGFDDVGGGENWKIMRNGDHTIGLFQGMFDSNLMTFNPGWDRRGEVLDGFTDIRELRKEFRNKGVKFVNEVINETGPASFMISDPDGNL
jgi:catechol 2,3-dioxygenase-like lactoylglutathione lyase family enzyme